MEMLGLFSTEEAGTLADFMDRSAFDEKFEIELARDWIRNIYHVENKYYVPVMNGSFRAMYEYGKEHMVDPDERAFNDIMNPDTIAQRLEDASPRGVVKVECREKMVDGSYRWVQYIGISGTYNGVPEGKIYFYVYDIQNQKDRLNGESSIMCPVSEKDPLTGVYKREQFIGAANELIQRAYGDWCCVAIDIQHFKLFSTWYGREKGDYVLASIGLALQELERTNDAVAAYFGRDNFGVVMRHDKELINELYMTVKNIILSYSNNVGIMPAVGIYLLPETETFDLDAYDKSRIAIDKAKRSYTERIMYFDDAEYKKRREDHKLLTEFQAALKNEEICFFIQPQCVIENGRIIGGEALARWIRPDGTMVSPGAFIPVLEQTGFIAELDKYLWEAVCKWQRAIIDRGIRPVPVSVNVSQIELLTMDVAAYLYGLTQRYNIPPRLLKVEITESAYAENFQMISDEVAEMKEKGFKVYLDDFGNGYSSLNMLDKVNADVMKLDMAFMRKDSALSKKGISIVESIISMTKTLTIPMIVEGVENAEQVTFLKNLGCLYAQGYYFYKPMTVAAFEGLLQDSSKMDYQDVHMRATELFHTRDFLNEQLFTDAMLNNILGPVAFYFQDKNGMLSITRFNQQFYDCIADAGMSGRQQAIQNYILEEDHPAFYKMLSDACEDPVKGGECTVRFRKSAGGVFWYNMHLFFLRENEQGKMYYGKIADATGMYHQGSAFYELLKENADYGLRIDLTNELIYELQKDKPFDDPNVRVMNTKESLLLTAEQHILDPEQRQQFVEFFAPERLKRSHAAGIYSETFTTRFKMGDQYVTTQFAAYYIKFVPDQEDSVYVFANRTKE